MQNKSTQTKPLHGDLTLKVNALHILLTQCFSELRALKDDVFYWKHPVEDDIMNNLESILEDSTDNLKLETQPFAAAPSVSSAYCNTQD